MKGKKLIEYEELMKQWDYEKNKENPSEISSGSKKKYWWKCHKGEDHQWEAQVRERAKGSNCPYCMGRKLSKTNNLEYINPTLAKEWNMIKNKDLKPNQVFANSSIKAWWQCSKDKTHEWDAKISTRNKGTGCPFCSNRNATKDDNLKVNNPTVAKYWHPNKNAELTPDKIKEKSSKVIWWMCPRDHNHEWELSVNSMVKRKTYCLLCENGEKNESFEITEEEKRELEKEWHPTKNGDLILNEINEKTKEEFWWQCKENKEHEWQKSIEKKINNSECPICKKNKNKEKIKEEHKHLIEEWHPTKNENQTIFDFNLYTHKKAWWQCSKDKTHEWEAQISNRANGTKCPYCVGAKATEEENLEKEMPNLMKEWHPTKNKDIDPSSLRANSSKRVWWQCSKDKTHEWDATVNKRTKGRGCPYCTSQKIDKKNSLGHTNPKLIKEWHPTKNKKIKPTEIAPNSGIKVWWQCKKIKHMNGKQHQR